MLYTKIQPNIPCGSGENVDSIGLPIFSNSYYILFSTRMNFIVLKPCSLIMLHMKFEIHGCSGFRE